MQRARSVIETADAAQAEPLLLPLQVETDSFDVSRQKNVLPDQLVKPFAGGEPFLVALEVSDQIPPINARLRTGEAR